MGNMEFLYQNYVNTTTIVTVTSGSTSVARLFDRKPSIIYSSSGDDSDLTTTSISVEFSSNKSVDRIVLQNINLKSFNIYYNSNTANKFSLSADCLTQTSEFSSNSATSLYLMCNTTTTISSFQIAATSTIDANEEKKIGELWVSGQILQLERNPNARDYKISRDRREFKHTMSDGGVATYVIQDNQKADIKIKYISDNQYDDFDAMYNLLEPIVFVPFPTGTGWQNEKHTIWEMNWTDDFDETFSSNIKGNGFNARLRLSETPK